MRALHEDIDAYRAKRSETSDSKDSKRKEADKIMEKEKKLESQWKDLESDKGKVEAATNEPKPNTDVSTNTGITVDVVNSCGVTVCQACVSACDAPKCQCECAKQKCGSSSLVRSDVVTPTTQSMSPRK